MGKTVPSGDGPIVGLFVDFYGTVASGDRACIEGICRQVVEYGELGMDAGAMASIWGRHFFDMIERSNGEAFRTLAACERDSLELTLAEVGVDGEPEQFIDIERVYWRSPPVYPDAAAVLGEIGLPICLVSNADDAELAAAVEGAGLRFDHVVTSERARSYKPDSAIFEMALAETGWARERVLHVGDSRHSDVAGAAAVGIAAVWMHRPDRVGDRPNGEPDYTVADFYELAALVAEVQAAG